MPYVKKTSPGGKYPCNVGLRISIEDHGKLLAFADDLGLTPMQALRLLVRQGLRAEARGFFVGEPESAGVASRD